MGYRSEGGFWFRDGTEFIPRDDRKGSDKVIVANVGDVLAKFMLMHSEAWEMVKEIDALVVRRENDKVVEVYLEFYGWKWYDGYEDVEALKLLRDFFAENQCNGCWARIGENYDDVEYSEYNNFEGDFGKRPITSLEEM